MKCHYCEHVVYGTIYKCTRHGMIPRIVTYCDINHSRVRFCFRCQAFKQRKHMEIVQRYP